MATSRAQQSGFLASVREFVVLLLIVFLIRTFGFGLYQVPTGSMETTMLVGERFFADKLTPLFSSIQRGEIIAFNSPTYKYSKNRLVKLFQEYVWGPINWTKRVVGIPGDRIRGTVEDGKPVIYINDKKINEPYLNKFPLIKVLKMDRHVLERRLQKMGRKALMMNPLTPKSYDPAYSFEDQPYYKIKKERVWPRADAPEFLYPGRPLPSRPVEHEVGQNYWGGTDEFYVELGKNQFWVMGDNRRGSSDSRFIGPIDGRLIHGRIVYRILSVDSDASWLLWDLITHPIDFWRRVRRGRNFQRVR